LPTAYRLLPTGLYPAPAGVEAARRRRELLLQHLSRPLVLPAPHRRRLPAVLLAPAAPVACDRLLPPHPDCPAAHDRRLLSLLSRVRATVHGLRWHAPCST